MAFIMTSWIGNGTVLKSFIQWQLKKLLQMNNSWAELFNFELSFNCH